jgi:hypothetical protein
MLKAVFLLAVLISSSAQTASFDGLWEGKPSPNAEAWDANGRPVALLPYRVRIEGEIVHQYSQVNGKYVEDVDRPIKIAIVGNDAFITYPTTNDDVVVITGGTLLEQKDANTLAVWRAPVSDNGMPAKDHSIPQPDWIRVGK